MSWSHHFDRGDLNSAITSIRELLKRAPTASNLALLAMLLGLAGRWEDAVVSLHRAASKDPSNDAFFEEIEHWIWADRSRDHRRNDPLWTEPRRWLAPPPVALELLDQASALFVARDIKKAAAVSEDADAKALRQPGELVTRAGTHLTFEDIVDVDSFTGASFELVSDVLIDVPFASLRRLVVRESTTFRDSIWRPVTVEPRDAKPFEARIPALYPGSFRSSKALAHVGKAQVIEERYGMIRALGKREFRLISSTQREAIVALDSVAEITFAAPVQRQSARIEIDPNWPVVPNAPNGLAVPTAQWVAPPADARPTAKQAEPEPDTWRPPPATERSGA
ncbi:MAG: type VI secretion system accessory protein TagJ [Polyangiaceae bacterium]